MYQNFVSKNSIDQKKKERKDYFQDKLKKAQEDYESVKRVKELENQRGDSKWILPSLDERLTEDNKKKKKKKKHKKHKKGDKQHKKKHRQTDSSSQDEDSDGEWEESSSATTTTTKSFTDCTFQSQPRFRDEETETLGNIQREDWMLSSSLLDIASKSTYSRQNQTKLRKQEEKQKDAEERKTALESRELNPYFKDGGSGMPTSQNEIKTEGKSTENFLVGDGGKSWLHKAYDRALRQSKEQDIPLEEIIAKRWGSMEKFNAMLKASERSSSASKSSSSSWKKSSSHSSEKGKQKAIPPEPEKLNRIDSPDNNKDVSPTTVSTRKSEEGESSESESTGDEMEQEVVALSEKEKNEISAKMLRAELMGDDELAGKLKEQLHSGTVTKIKRKKNQSENEAREQDVILTRTDKHGNLYPIQLQTSSDELTQKRKRKKKLMATHGDDGKRNRYFEDDDSTDLKTMVQQERMTSASDQSAMMSRLASKHLGKAQGDDYTLDDMFVTASATKGSVRNEDKRTREKAMKEHKKRENQLSSCRFCFDNPNIAKHLIVAIGKKTYLALPINASLTEGHSLILPLHHAVGQTFLDEDVLNEVKMFKNALTKMFSSQDEDVVFLETCKHLRHQNHCIIECIPVPREIGDMAPIYFKKALMESESEWSQNKKVVEIKSKDGITKAIPKGLPYFAVEFGMDGGFGHIIEDEEGFQHYFGKEVIGGMLDLEPMYWRKPPKQSFDRHKRKVLQFAEQWKGFDWTKRN